jgi:hypothetical protein
MTMRLRLSVVAAILLAGCAIQPPPAIQPPVIQPPPVIQQPPVVQQPPVTQQAPVLPDSPKSQVNKNRDQDLVECERESAFAGVGEKRRVFDNCMKARGY